MLSLFWKGDDLKNVFDFVLMHAIGALVLSLLLLLLLFYSIPCIDTTPLQEWYNNLVFDIRHKHNPPTFVLFIFFILTSLALLYFCCILYVMKFVAKSNMCALSFKLLNANYDWGFLKTAR